MPNVEAAKGRPIPGKHMQRNALQRFRREYDRFDYYPGDAALEAIRSMTAKHQDESMRAILDTLVLSGYRSLTKDVGLFPESNKA